MTVDMLCPGLQLERSPLSASHLALGVSRPHAYKPRDVVLAQLAGTNYLLADSVNVAETLLDLITFGDAEVRDVPLITSCRQYVLFSLV